MKRLVLVSMLAALCACAGGAVATAKPPPKPKLKVAAVADPPPIAKAGESFGATATVANKGKRAARARLRVSLRSGVRGDPIGPVAVSERHRVKAKGEREFTATLTVGASVPTGTYDLVACVKRRGTQGRERCERASSRIEVTSGSPPPSDFKPGARTLGDPLLPQIGNGGYDAGGYAIDLDYDPVANRFDSATTTMNATATQNLSELSLDFQDLPVDAVTVNGAAATFSQVGPSDPLGDPSTVTQPMKLVVTPAAGIASGSAFTVEVDYHGEPQVFTDPDGSLEGWIPACYTMVTEVCDSNFVVGEPMGSQAWFPSNNYPSDKATFDTSISLPSDQRAFGIGELVGSPVDNGDGTSTWKWSEDDPTSTYLVTASNGDFNYSETTATETATARTIPIYNALDPSATPLQQTNFDTVTGRNSALLDFLGQRFGPYPFDSYGAIYDRTGTSVNYALEVQTKSHFPNPPNDSAVNGGTASTYLHELSHMWFGDAVTLEQWDDIWFNEGWARFSENEYDYAFPGNSGTTPQESFDAIYDDPSFNWSLAPASLGGDPANLFDGDATYARPGAMLEGLRLILENDTAFFGFAKSIQTQFAYGNISTAEFVNAAKAASGFSGARLTLLGGYFQQWLYGTVKPTITPADFAP